MVGLVRADNRQREKEVQVPVVLALIVSPVGFLATAGATQMNSNGARKVAMSRSLGPTKEADTHTKMSAQLGS